MSRVYSGKNSIQELTNLINNEGRYLLVYDSAFNYLDIKQYINSLSNIVARFDEFTPNPLYDDVCKGVKCFLNNNCNGIIAIGGGSTIDVAKCIKLFSCLDPDIKYLNQQIVESNVTLIAIPTTAGTGSEATHFAVIYSNKQKLSIAHQCLIPNYVILDSALLQTLPLYQKKCTMLDALCHAIESWWSVNSTDESKEYSKSAIRLIFDNKDNYLNNNDNAAEKMLLAANLAGKAINITKTTAAHAMSYKLTSLFGLPHGHAVAICLPKIWDYMSNNIEKCVDVRGPKYVESVFVDISKEFGYRDISSAIDCLNKLLLKLNIIAPQGSVDDLKILADSVNAERLKNNPIAITNADFYTLYKTILKQV